MATQNLNENWQLLSQTGNSPKVLALQSGNRPKYAEDPLAPEADLIAALKDIFEGISTLVLPPCSEETIKKAQCTLPNLKQILVFDNNSERLKLWQTLDLEKKFSTIKSVPLSGDSRQAELEFDQELTQHTTDLALGKAALYLPPRFQRIDRKFCSFIDSVFRTIKQKAISSAAHETTRNWHKVVNLLQNIKHIGLPSHNLKSSTSTPGVVIVGAGPSLDKNIQILAQNTENVIVIATDASLTTLLKHNITPDLIVSLEDVLSWQFFAKNLDKLRTTPLIIPVGGNHVVAQNYPGPIVFSKSKDSQLPPTLSKPLIPLDNGYCVGHQAFSVAELFCPNEIIMIGFDLAYDNDKTHSSEMAVQVDKSFEDNYQYVYVDGIHEKKVKTSQNLYYYLQYFEKMISRSNFPVIDATEGGAFIHGSEVSTLQATLEKYSQPTSLELEEKKSTNNIGDFMQELKKDLDHILNLIQKAHNDIDNISITTIFNPFTTFPLATPAFKLIKKCSNSFLLTEFTDILNHFTPDKFDLYKAKLNDLLNDLASTSDMLNTICSLNNFEKNNEKALLLAPDKIPAEAQEIIKTLTYKHVTTLQDDTDLISAIKTIQANQISTIISLNGNVLPDMWSIPNINCLDIKTEFAPHTYERFLWIPKYTLLCSNSSILEKWQDFCPDTVECKIASPK